MVCFEPVSRGRQAELYSVEPRSALRGQLTSLIVPFLWDDTRGNKLTTMLVLGRIRRYLLCLHKNPDFDSAGSAALRKARAD